MFYKRNGNEFSDGHELSRRYKSDMNELQIEFTENKETGGSGQLDDNDICLEISKFGDFFGPINYPSDYTGNVYFEFPVGVRRTVYAKNGLFNLINLFRNILPRNLNGFRNHQDMITSPVFLKLMNFIYSEIGRNPPNLIPLVRLHDTVTNLDPFFCLHFGQNYVPNCDACNFR